MPKQISRDDELSNMRGVRKQLLEKYKDIEKAFGDQHERADDILDYWDMYNNKLSERQMYNGTSKIFVPIVHDAIEARKTRFANQMFPQSGRYVEVTTTDDTLPHATMSLAEHYVRAAKLRTQVVPALCVAGDVEGQYSLYVGWRKQVRHVISKERKPVKVDGLEYPEHGEIEDITAEVIETGHPYAEVLADVDLLVEPITVDTLSEALDIGGSVTVVRRWTKRKIKDLIAEGEIDEDAGDAIAEAMNKDKPGQPNTKKKLADTAGIRGEGGAKMAVVYETWTKIKVGKERRIVRVYYGGDDTILGCKLNPFWCDEIRSYPAPSARCPASSRAEA